MCEAKSSYMTFLVRLKGLEPTRLATQEPKGNDTSVGERKMISTCKAQNLCG